MAGINSNFLEQCSVAVITLIYQEPIPSTERSQKLIENSNKNQKFWKRFLPGREDTSTRTRRLIYRVGQDFKICTLRKYLPVLLFPLENIGLSVKTFVNILCVNEVLRAMGVNTIK